MAAAPGLVRVREQDREFFAAVSGGKVARTKHGIADRGPYTPQALVAGEMPVKIIEALEMIDVDHDQPEPGLVAPRAQMLLRKRFVECPAIGKTGETILSCERAEAAIGFRKLILHSLTYGNVAQSANDSCDSAAIGVS
jgi:hypothetical protein